MDEDEKVLDSETSTEEESSEDTSTEEVSEEQPKPRTADARINELTGKIKELEEKLEAKGTEETRTPMPSTEAKVTPEVQRAIEQLKNLGFVSKDELEEKIRTVEDRSVLNSEHIRLSNAYSGSDGRPKYDKGEIEKFMRNRSVYDPEIAYYELHRAELLDWELKKADEKKKKQPYVESRGQSSGESDGNTITREKIAEWMKTPEGRIKYERNRDKILTLLQQGQL